MEAKDALYCAHNSNPAAGTSAYGQRVRVLGEHVSPEGIYHCCGGGAGCSIYESMGCWPKVAECRYACQLEPKKDAGSEPRIVDGVYCLGEDFCVKDECTPEPRFSREYW